MIPTSRRRWHQPTIDYIARRRADGKPAAKQPAASSATSPATSTGFSNTRQ
jgi:hypothetical protein